MVLFALVLVLTICSSATSIDNPGTRLSDEIKDVPWLLEEKLMEQPLGSDSFPFADGVLPSSGCDVGQVE